MKHAQSVDRLRDLLASGGGDGIFTTIEKFRQRTDRGEIDSGARNRLLAVERKLEDALLAKETP